jgi:hypothetical protein
MKNISTMARTVLGYFVEPIADASPQHIDAEFFADEIVELLWAGYVRLEGTLQQATLHATPEGIEAYILSHEKVSSP